MLILTSIPKEGVKMLMHRKSLFLVTSSFLLISRITRTENKDLTDSEWPPGSYAIPMTIDGCPEEVSGDWMTSHIRITTKHPMDKLESYRGCTAGNASSYAFGSYSTGEFKQISGLYEAYTLQINFCYKTKKYQPDLNASWPIGNYSIYDVEDDCPNEFDADSVNICLPQILAVDYGGYIPFVSFGSTKSNEATILQFRLCTRNNKDVSSSKWNWPETHPFTFLRVPDQECPTIAGHRMSEEMLPLFAPIIDEGVYYGHQLSFCYFMPTSYVFGVRADYVLGQEQEVRNKFKDCRGLLYVNIRLDEYSCGRHASGSCDKAVELTIDAGKVVRTSGVLIQFERFISYYKFVDLFSNNTRVYTADGARVCRHNEIAWNNSESDLNVVFTCIRTLTARYITLTIKVEQDSELLKNVMADAFVTLLSCASDMTDTNVSSCQSELGMRDFGLQDFQLSASSSQTSHEPKQARPHYNGWCAALYDKQPYLQVDLLSVTTVEGIVIFNWVETENYSFENVYSVETHIRGCQSFIVEHGISKDSFVQLSKEPFTIDKSREVEEPRTIIFYESFPARYLRLYPLGHDNRKPVCLKLELLGCRKRGTLSLSCHQNQHRDIFETDQIFIPSSNKIETRFNMSYSDCQDFCLYNRTECVGIDLSNSTCKLFMSDERQSYKRLQSNSGAATVPCWQGGVLLETIYFNIFEDSLLNTQDKRIVVNNFSVLTSVGYPFRYDDNQVDRWNISSATGKLITLQFTDISLKTYDRVEDSRLFQNKGLCKDEIIVTTKETYRIANHSEGIIYSFDNKYNGKYPNAPVPYSNIFLEFRTCTQRQTDAQLYRGFTVYIFEEDSRHICLPDIFCETSPMELSSGSFLGHLLLDVDMVIEWYIDHAYKHSVRFELLDFDISCSSGTQFIITAASTYTGTWQKTFCNGNRTYGAFQVDGDFFFVQFYTTLETCGQLLFQEGFRLSFRTPESKDKLMNLTTSQQEIIDNLPIMVTITSFPIQKADASADKFNEGRVRIVCSDTFKKCYTIYIGMPPMSWMDSMNMCRQRNKTLVRYRSKLEMEYVRLAVSAWMMDIDIPVLRYYYYSIRLIIGLTRFAINNQRYRDYWSDGSLAEFTAWDMNEPKDVYFRRCTSMSLSDNRGWKTENCDEMSLVNIVCETATTQGSVTPLVVELQPDENAENKTQHLLFKCKSGEWLSRLAKCNGVGECIDSSDEQDCFAEGICEADEFQCGGGRCIHISKMCDYVYDCNDLSDELCEYEMCPVDSFACDGIVCLNPHQKCDAVVNCKDGSDEINCDDCPGSFACALSKTCIPESYVCDGLVDCNDASDESNCSQLFKTCEELLNVGISESGMKILDGKYIYCDFEKDEIGNRIKITMIYHNVDWLHHRGAEYNLEPQKFIRDALTSGYTCSQKFTQETRHQRYVIKELANLTSLESNHVVLQYNPFESNATTDTFEIHFTSESVQLRYFDSFDVNNNRIAIGPIICTKDFGANTTGLIDCGIGIRPVDTSRHCLYNIDSDFHIDGCVTLNHLQDCAEFICPDGYVKCPGSYCIYSHRVCDGNVDCIYGEDEENCWCLNDKKTILIFIDMTKADKFHKKANRLASKLYFENNTVVVFQHYFMSGVMEGNLIKSYNGHELVYDRNEYKVNINPAFKIWPEWSFENLLGLHKLFTSAKTHLLIFISESRLSEYEHIISNNMIKFIGISNGETHVLNIREDPSIKSNTKIVPSSVSEILVRNWKVLDAVGPLLLKEHCRSLENTSCSWGYRCLMSRVCLPLAQLCDSIIQCPEGDDEMNCEFKCPSFCTCGVLTMKCSEEVDNETFPIWDIHSSTRSLDLSTTKSFGKAFLTAYDRDVDFRYLISLNLSQCEITGLSDSYFSRMKNLRTLDISYNRLARLTSSVFALLVHLTNLHLHGNSFLTYIEPGAFNGLKIHSLDFTGCSISEISMNTFDGLTMEELDLSFNKIEEIGDNAFNRLSVKYLKLQGNRISIFTKNMFRGLTDVENLHTPAYKFCCIRPSYQNEESCLPHKDEFSSCADLMRNGTLQGLLWTIGSLALIGNLISLVYRLYFDKKSVKMCYGIFVTNLAVSDLLMGFYLFIIAIADRVFRNRYIEAEDYWRNSVWCRLAGVLSTVSSEASVLFIALITIDRILVIKFPFGNYRLPVRMGVALCIACWVSVLFLSTLPLIYVEYFSDGFYSKSAVCLALPLTRDRPPGWQYSTSIFIGFNFVMFVLIAIGQLLIYLEVKKHTSAKLRTNVTRRNDLKVARNLLMLVTTDFMCWFPIGCMGIMAINGQSIPGEVYAWTAVLVLPINSALNPFLYTISAIISAKAFTPRIEEQNHVNLSEGRQSGQSISLSDLMTQRPLTMDEIAWITVKITRALSSLHKECLVLETLGKQNIVIQISPKRNKIRNLYLDQQPHMSSGKLEKAEDVLSLGCLIRECIESLNINA